MPESNRDAKLAASVALLPGGRVDGAIRPPGSKSLTNRALICAGFASGRSELRGALRSEDTEVMIDSLTAIGAQIASIDGGRTLIIDGVGAAGPLSTEVADGPPTELFIANSGTSLRFLTAALSAAGGQYRLHGVERMHARPIGDLVDAIAPVIAGTIEAISPGGCPPVHISSSGWQAAGLGVGGSISSQYLSGLMMAAPIAQATQPLDKAVRIGVTGALVSRPYVDMTAAVMRSFGADVDLLSNQPAANQSLEVVIGDSPYRATRYNIEPDASAASYFWGAAAISGGQIRVDGLSRGAIQGDVGFCDVLAKMGCDVEYGDDYVSVTGRPLRGVDIDMNEISDTVQTLSVVALFAEGATRVRGVAHNRYKETDRIGDLARELRKLGATIDEHEDGLTIRPPDDKAELHGATMETYHDHRMAMSLSLAGLRIPGVRILNPACTSKTYPEYFADLEALIGRPHHWHSV
jgi:3-phosphoshikimate 1-carboxyvinyltransferase